MTNTAEQLPNKEMMATIVAGFSVASDKHPDRNIDSFFVDNGAVGVFDGVGGKPGSEDASRLASQVVSEYLKDVPTMVPRELGRMAVQSALQVAHESIIAQQSGNIATTAVIAKLFETEEGRPYAAIGHAGDSRAYLFRGGALTQLTLDHASGTTGYNKGDAELIQEILSDVAKDDDFDNEVIVAPHLRDVARVAFKYRNFIASCLGSHDDGPDIEVLDINIYRGDKLVVTSDGVHDNLTTYEIESIVGNQASPDVIVQALVTASQNRSRVGKKAHIRAKPDDITAAILAV